MITCAGQVIQITSRGLVTCAWGGASGSRSALPCRGWWPQVLTGELSPSAWVVWSRTGPKWSHISVATSVWREAREVPLYVVVAGARSEQFTMSVTGPVQRCRIVSGVPPRGIGRTVYQMSDCRRLPEERRPVQRRGALDLHSDGDSALEKPVYHVKSFAHRGRSKRPHLVLLVGAFQSGSVKTTRPRSLGRRLDRRTGLQQHLGNGRVAELHGVRQGGAPRGRESATDWIGPGLDPRRRRPRLVIAGRGDHGCLRCVHRPGRPGAGVEQDLRDLAHPVVVGSSVEARERHVVDGLGVVAPPESPHQNKRPTAAGSSPRIARTPETSPTSIADRSRSSVMPCSPCAWSPSVRSCVPALRRGPHTSGPPISRRLGLVRPRL